MTRAAFCYAQARVAARHGLRPNHDVWRRLDASTSLAHLLEAARASSLRSWVERVHALDGPHEIERSLRAEFAAHALEVASWVTEPWRPAVAWTRVLALVPFAQAWPATAPAWTDSDAALSQLDASKGEVAPLFDATLGATPLERWTRAWRARWPRTSTRERAGLDLLTAALGKHREAMRSADAASNGWRRRSALEARLRRLYRQHAEEPAAVFCHLAFTALDLERLRARLLGRALFGHAKGSAAWV